MLNLYSVNKKLRDLEEENRIADRDKKWENWKRHNNDNWMRSYKHRLEKFVNDVEENTGQYNELFKHTRVNPFQNLRKYPGAACIGPERFYFNSFKTEKERIEVWSLARHRSGVGEREEKSAALLCPQ